MKALVTSRTQSELGGLMSKRQGSYIFHGQRAVGKATVAYELSKLINCLGDDPAICAACRQHDAQAYPDLITLRPEDKPSILIEQVRSLVGSLGLSLYHAKATRVVIIDDAHMMTVDAQNALLKLIEEPPPQTIFILVTERIESLIPTVRSRCGAIFFPRVPSDTISAWLTANNRLKPSDAATLAAASGGAPGLALGLMANPAEAVSRLELAELAERVPVMDTFGRLIAAKKLIDTKADLVRFGYLLHAKLLMDAQAQDAPVEQIAAQMDVVETYRRQFMAKVSPKVALESLMLSL